MDTPTVLISAAAGVITSAITAYFTSKLKISEEREKWARDVSQKYAEAQQTNPAVAASLAKQFAIALLIVDELEHPGGRGRQKIFVPPNSRLVVGRAPGSDIVVEDGMLSSHHAAFLTDQTHIFVESLGAKAGVFVNNGVRVDGRVSLRAGDEVTMGNTRFEVLLLS
jgi:pSer/pThr/pTyr-binding forkhead associated (FHA) protein